MQHHGQGTVGTPQEASIFHDRSDNGPDRVGQAYSTEERGRILISHEPRLGGTAFRCQ